MLADNAPTSTTISIHAPLRKRRRKACRPSFRRDFNPRSLAGATEMHKAAREVIKFQFTLPCGSDALQVFSTALSVVISIHAPLRERPARTGTAGGIVKFQSTLPYGSDKFTLATCLYLGYFNPRFLAGATV